MKRKRDSMSLELMDLSMSSVSEHQELETPRKKIKLTNENEEDIMEIVYHKIDLSKTKRELKEENMMLQMSEENSTINQQEELYNWNRDVKMLFRENTPSHTKNDETVNELVKLMDGNRNMFLTQSKDSQMMDLLSTFDVEENGTLMFDKSKESDIEELQRVLGQRKEGGKTLDQNNHSKFKEWINFLEKKGRNKQEEIDLNILEDHMHHEVVSNNLELERMNPNANNFAVNERYGQIDSELSKNQHMNIPQSNEGLMTNTVEDNMHHEVVSSNGELERINSNANNFAVIQRFNSIALHCEPPTHI